MQNKRVASEKKPPSSPSLTLEKLAQKVARKVSPTVQDARSEKKFTQTLLSRLSPALPEARLILVGSTARDTGLTKDKDVDVFACFPTNWEEEAMVKKTVAAVKKNIPAKWEMHYAEHPYLQAQVGAFRVEVIPCFEAQPHGGIKSAVDRSPLHMDFLQSRLTQTQRQDVRALKVLLKNHGIYGAEAHVRGFSGILCEYLILHFGSFSRLLESAKNWKPPIRIDLVPSKKTFAEPLVVIDAVDHNRNVSAVVSRTQLHRFISLSQTLWEQPEKNELFFPKKRTYTAHQLDQEFKKRGTRTFRVSIKRPDVVEDILLPQAERTLSNLEKQFTLAGFSVLSSAYADDVKQLHFLLELAQDNLPAVQKIQGPAVFNEKACREFIKNKKNVLRGPFVQEERLFVEQIRAIRTADALFKKIKKAPVRFGVASHLCRPFKNANIRSDFSGLSKPAIVAFGSHVFRKEAWLSR